MRDAPRHLAHFNWATLKADSGSPEVAGFETATPKVNALAERSPGFVWRDGSEAAHGCAIGWPLFTKSGRVIASFSVWDSPDNLRDFVFKTVHGAFYSRAGEWFEPGTGVNYVLWWIPAGHIPDMAEARDRVDRLLVDGPTDAAFNFDYLETHA